MSFSLTIAVSLALCVSCLRKAPLSPSVVLFSYLIDKIILMDKLQVKH